MYGYGYGYGYFGAYGKEPAKSGHNVQKGTYKYHELEAKKYKALMNTVPRISGAYRGYKKLYEFHDDRAKALKKEQDKAQKKSSPGTATKKDSSSPGTATKKSGYTSTSAWETKKQGPSASAEVIPPGVPGAEPMVQVDPTVVDPAAQQQAIDTVAAATSTSEGLSTHAKIGIGLGVAAALAAAAYYAKKKHLI